MEKQYQLEQAQKKAAKKASKDEESTSSKKRAFVHEENSTIPLTKSSKVLAVK